MRVAEGKAGALTSDINHAQEAMKVTQDKRRQNKIREDKTRQDKTR
jgi:hypothetical protein